MEWLNFIATEVHKQFGPLWYPTTPDATKEAQRAKLATRFDLICEDAREAAVPDGRDVHRRRRVPLHDRSTGRPMLKIDLAPWPALQQFQARVAARPAVHAALKAEGLVKERARPRNGVMPRLRRRKPAHVARP